jgi:predicted transcriptional regulator/ribosomal protein L37AE/L43A
LAILEKEVYVGLNPQTIVHYSKLGYVIPKYKDGSGIERVKKGTVILVKVKDLLNNSKVTKVCDFCEKKVETTLARIMLGRSKWGDGKDRCKECSDNEKFDVIHAKKLQSNCVAITHPDFSKLFWKNEDTYLFTHQSNKKTDFKCPTCDTQIKNKRIQDVYKYGLSCLNCTDGYSYPEKFMFNLLNQFNMEFETQKNFSWSQGKRYDFYIPSLNCIIETHGIQHYEGQGFKAYGDDARTSKEERVNDILKIEMAMLNGVNDENYIIIDSRRSTVDFMEKSILCNYKFNKIIDTSLINFKECHEFACNNVIKAICELFNQGYKNAEISKQLKISSHTVGRYLKQAKHMDLCDYKPHMNRHREVVQLSLEGKYIDSFNSLTQAEKKTGANNISNACSGRSNSSGGYKWMYKEDYDKYIAEQIT